MGWHGFIGAARRIEDVDLPRIAHTIGVDEDVIHAVIDVESAGSGFDAFERPRMLFEPHIFYRLLHGEQRTRAVREGLAYKVWGHKPYPSDSYGRLERAIEINETAALQSASWGLGQIMGFNHAAAGYATVQDMVRAFLDDEAVHLEAMIQYIVTHELDDDLRRQDWAGFARGYNGPGYARHGYHHRLATRYRYWRSKPNTPWDPRDAEAEEDASSAGRFWDLLWQKMKERISWPW